MHLHAIQDQAGLTSYFQQKPSISQIMHLHAIQDQAELTIYLQRKTIDQPDNAFTRNSESSGTHRLFATENHRSAG